MSAALSDSARALLDAPNFAVIGTVNPDNAPHTAVVCVVLDGDDVLISTTRSRQLGGNALRDSRASLSVFDLNNPCAR